MAESDIRLLDQELKNYKNNTDKEIQDLKKITDEQEKRIQAIERSKEKTDFQYDQIMKTLEKLNNETIPNLTAQIEELKNKPVKRYDQVITAFIGAIVGAIGAAIASMFIH